MCNHGTMGPLFLQEKIASLSELRTNIQTKQKSLKRRRGGGSVSSSTMALKEGLNKQIEELTTLIDLTRRLSQCSPSEGKALYDTIQSINGLSVGQEIWKRAMKAWTFEAGVGMGCGCMLFQIIINYKFIYKFIFFCNIIIL